jgi:hypothetical protein
LPAKKKGFNRMNSIVRKKLKIIFTCFLALIFVGFGRMDAENAPVTGTASTGTTVEVYAPFEWRIEADPGKLNPFDPEECSYDAVFTRPDKSQVKVPGFYSQDFEPGSRLQPKDKPKWIVRFCPTREGTYNFTTTLRIGKTTIKTPPATMTAVAGFNKGFVQPGSPNNHYFCLTSGGSFYPVGMAVAWTSHDKLLEEYENYFKKISENGGNFTRVWNCEWNLPLEWNTNDELMGNSGLGRYNLQTAWRMDRLFDLARQYGIRIILTLDNYGELMVEKGPWNEQAWTKNPYCSKNGGPCEKPWDFFSNSKARRLYQNRLRYIAARWGWTPQLFAVEFFNEVNLPPQWLKEMAATFLSYDPNRHLIIMSQGYPWGQAYDASQAYSQENIGSSIKHYYGQGAGGWGLAGEVRKTSLEMVSRYKKPFFFEEIGLDGMKDDIKIDLQGHGTHLHNALWAAVASLSAAAPLSHWKEYVLENNLFHEFKAVRSFADSVDWVSQDWKSVDAMQNLGSTDDKPSDLIIPIEGDWNARNEKLVTVSAEGEVEGGFAAYLKTTSREGGTPLKLELDASNAVTLTIRVEKVSVGAELVVSVDGKAVTQWRFDPAPGSGDAYESTALDPQWKIDVGVYHKDYAVAFPPGKHSVVVDNKGRDWVLLEKATLSGMKQGLQARLYGLAGSQMALGWIQDKRNTWQNVYENGWNPVPMEGVSFQLSGLVDGTYKLKWWDTESGEKTDGGEMKVEKGNLALKVPAFTGDIAFTMAKQDKQSPIPGH